MNMEFQRKLPVPKEVKEQFPLTETMIRQKESRDKEIASVFSGDSDRFLLIVGPCSADQREPVVEYIGRLKKVQELVKDKIIIIPRVYSNKPRTTGEGYKGMLHQPDPDGKPDLLRGVIAIRDLHREILRDYGFSCADELLYPENYRYLSDILSYVTVGARSVENQQHRLVSSGLDVPVGMKNPTGGDLSIMMHAIKAAQSGHTFMYRGWEVTSKGNPLAHAVLRGYMDFSGKNMPNYRYDDLIRLYEMCQQFGLFNLSAIVDCNHANSGKKPLEQVGIAQDVVNSRRKSTSIKSLIKGLMIESYLEDGAQPVGGDVYGKSITDPCLGWEKTEQLILELADRL